MNNVMLQDKEYQDIAKKIIFSNFNTSIASFIINDPIRFGCVVNSVMMADYQWNGIGNVEGYRKQMCRWCVQKFIKSIYNKNNQAISLDFQSNNDENFEPLTKKHQNNLDEIEAADYNDNMRKRILNSNILTKREKNILIKYLLENYTVRELATILKIRTEAIRQTIKRAANKIGPSLCGK